MRTARLEMENWVGEITHVDFSVLLLLKTCKIADLNLRASSPNSIRNSSILNKIHRTK